MSRELCVEIITISNKTLRLDSGGTKWYRRFDQFLNSILAHDVVHESISLRNLISSPSEKKGN